MFIHKIILKKLAKYESFSLKKAAASIIFLLQPTWILSGQGRENKAIWNTQNGFTKGKSGLTTMTGLCDKITWLAEEGRGVDAIYFSQ